MLVGRQSPPACDCRPGKSVVTKRSDSPSSLTPSPVEDKEGESAPEYFSLSQHSTHSFRVWESVSSTWLRAGTALQSPHAGTQQQVGQGGCHRDGLESCVTWRSSSGQRPSPREKPRRRVLCGLPLKGEGTLRGGAWNVIPAPMLFFAGITKVQATKQHTEMHPSHRYNKKPDPLPPLASRYYEINCSDNWCG